MKRKFSNEKPCWKCGGSGMDDYLDEEDNIKTCEICAGTGTEED